MKENKTQQHTAIPPICPTYIQGEWGKHNGACNIAHIEARKNSGTSIDVNCPVHVQAEYTITYANQDKSKAIENDKSLCPMINPNALILRQKAAGI